jgi:hypothetical protein
MSDNLENNIPLTTEVVVQSQAEPEEYECFAPFIPPAAVPAPKPKPAPRESSLGKLVEKICGFTPTAPPPESGDLAPTATGELDENMARPNENLATLVEAPLPEPRKATAVELIGWIKRSLLAQTHLPGDDAELVAYWVLSTWFQDALTVLPCLVITGPTYDAMVLLNVLRTFCWEPAMVSGFRRSNVKALNWTGHTILISEPYLDKRTAALLGNLTDRNCLVVAGDSLTRCSKSTAIYAGENPVTHDIQHAIHVHITATNAAPPVRPPWLPETIERLPVHLDQYRETNLDYVRGWQFVPSGLPSAAAAIAAALGICILDAPKHRNKLVALLKAQNQQQRSQRSGNIDALVVEGVLSLSQQEQAEVFTAGIADEVNRLLELRGERSKLSPETVGRRLRKLGLRTHRLSLAGNGLRFDKAAIALIQQLAAVHVEEVLLVDNENPHSAQTIDNTHVM